MADKTYTLTVQVVDSAGAGRPIAQAQVTVSCGDKKTVKYTDGNGRAVFFDLLAETYSVEAAAFGQHTSPKGDTVVLNSDYNLPLGLPVGFQLAVGRPDGEPRSHAEVTEGSALMACLSWRKPRTGPGNFETRLTSTNGAVHHEPRHEELRQEHRDYYQVDLRATHGMARLEGKLIDRQLVNKRTVSSENPATITDEATASILPDSQSVTGDINVAMRRTATDATEDLSLWVVIRKSTEALSFNNYFRYMNFVLCGEPIGGEHHEHQEFESRRLLERFERLSKERFLPFTDSEAYRLLKVATEAFVMVNCGVALRNFQFDRRDIDLVARRVGTPVELRGLWHKYLHAVNGTPNATLPYLALIRDKMRDVPLKSSMFAHVEGDLPENCFGILRDKLTNPCLTRADLVVLARGGNARADDQRDRRRFQNVRGHGDHDPLANLEIDPLRPLNNLLWGYIQDEQHRLTVVRRAYEYDHQYGLRSTAGRCPTRAGRGHRARSSSRRSTTCSASAASSTSRTTTRR